MWWRLWSGSGVPGEREPGAPPGWHTLAAGLALPWELIARGAHPEPGGLALSCRALTLGISATKRRTCPASSTHLWAWQQKLWRVALWMLCWPHWRCQALPWSLQDTAGWHQGWGCGSAPPLPPLLWS